MSMECSRFFAQTPSPEATQDRLHRAGIKSCSQRAEAPPEEIQAVVGKTAPGATIESRIEQAAGLAMAKWMTPA